MNLTQGAERGSKAALPFRQITSIMSAPATKEVPLMEKITSLCKRRGYIFQSSEVYGGIGGFWDYGPLGAELKRNLRDAWWKAMTRDREDVLGLDATIIMHPAIWKASGHVDTFADMMRECTLTNKRVRADHVEAQTGEVVVYGGAVARSVFFQDDLVDLNLEPEFVMKWLLPETLTGKKTVSEITDSLIRLLVNRKEQMPTEVHPDANNQAVIQKLAKCAGKILDGTLILEVSVLFPNGIDKATRIKEVKSFYERKGVSNPELISSRNSKNAVVASKDFHPETGGKLSEARPFNLMLSTLVGPTATEENRAYLRPETAQAIFVQFKNVFDSSRIKIPFGICQIGKAFRNEVTPKNFTFRSREFEQMELEFFIAPDEAIQLMHGSVAQWSEGTDLSTPQPNWGWDLWHRYWVDQRTKFYATIGLGADVLDYYWQTPEDLAHYARACVDILFKFPFGTDELEGIAARGNFDLTQHQVHSGKSLEVFDEELRAAASKLSDAEKDAFTNSVLDAWEANAKSKGKSGEEARVAAISFCEKLLKGSYLPHVIEPSAGLDRLALAIISASYTEEEKTDVNGKKEQRTLMKLHPSIAPIKCGVFPLLKNRPELVSKAREVYGLLKKHFNCFYDETAAIGRRYARQDEIGTPFGVTIDFETLGETDAGLKDTVTVRERDSGAQERVKIADLPGYLLNRMG